MTTNPNTNPPSYEEFIGHLRSALHYLYDPVHLRRSPLVEYFGHNSAADRAAALLRTLTESIHALKPSEDEPPQSAAWTIYDILNLQYIRQFTRDVVASQLGISERQLRREQRLALEALAQQLWQRFDLDTHMALAASPEPLAPESATGLSTELDWLKSSETEELQTLHETLQSVQRLANPLAEQYGVTLGFQIEPPLEETLIPQVSLRSILLTILNAMIPRVEKGAIHFTILQAGEKIQIDISCARAANAATAASAATVAPAATARPSRPAEIDLDAARQLAAFYQVSLEVQDEPALFSASLCFSFPQPIPILVIDDNGDWLEMLKRYVIGSRYQVVATRESRLAAALAEKVQPAVIFLDVMMPNVDGWQVLSELRQVQATHSIPLVVCTVLPLADLALSLGVNAFLQKPITQEQFLHTIQEQINKNG